MPILASQKLKARLLALTRRYGLSKRALPAGLADVSTLCLPAEVLPCTRNSICWHEPMPLCRLHGLPRGALSGPVQEDKAQAHSALTALIHKQHHTLDSFDLRLLNGICEPIAGARDCESFEALTALPSGKAIRIISYKDFEKTLSAALPGFLNGHAIDILQASWRGARIFWAGEQRSVELACAIAYARRRELAIQLPAKLTHYQLNQQALSFLQLHYHVLAISSQAWTNPSFASLLIDSRAPYARLSNPAPDNAPDLLLLPKQYKPANVLGMQLLANGACDVAQYWQSLSETD